MADRVSLDKSTVNRLQYALLKVEAAMGDPVLEAEMLAKMHKQYDDEGITMPPKIKAFYNKESAKIVKELQTKLDKLKEKKAKIEQGNKIPY